MIVDSGDIIGRMNAINKGVEALVKIKEQYDRDHHRLMLDISGQIGRVATLADMIVAQDAETASRQQHKGQSNEE